MTDDSLWGAMERLRLSTTAGIDQLEAGIATIRGRVEHDCPWVGGCKCVEEGSLCGCSHQHSEHGEGFDYDGGCMKCPCDSFKRVTR